MSDAAPAAYCIAAGEIARSHRRGMPAAEVVAEILMRSDAGADTEVIAADVGVHPRTVKRLADAARQLAASGPRPPTIIAPDAWYSTREAADALPTTVSALVMQRHRGRAPVFQQKQPGASVLYRGADLIAWRDAGMPPK
ncbi:hypothetical protein ABQE62_05730 [Mycolicibacterium fortuitum]